jgi:hypothetical protein
MSNTLRPSPYAPANSPRRVALASTGSEAAGNLNVPNGRVNPRTGTVAESQSEPLIGRNGELNAGNQKHLETGRARRSSNVAVSAADRKKKHDRLVQAFHAQDAGKSMLAIGEVMGEEIWMTLGQ